MTKKLLTFLVMLSMVFSTLAVAPVLAEDVGVVPASGTIIKGKGNPTLYYVGEDGRRYVFPNSKTYFSWFDDFSGIKEIEMKDLYRYELGGNVRYKPGALLVKIQTDPKVYAVGPNGNLRWIKTEKIAKALYGKDWSKLIDDVPDGFFVNYKKGDPIESEDEFEPTEEGEQAPTISHNRGFKPLVGAKVRSRAQRMCGRLEGALERLQKRFERWGADITDEADEVLDKCYGIRDEIIDQVRDKKVTICHKGETLSIGAPAVRGHLRHGDTLGECGDDDSSDDSDSSSGNDDNQDDSTNGGDNSGDNSQGQNGDSSDNNGGQDDSSDSNDDSQDMVDTTAPVISNIVASPSATSTAVTWDTDEESSSKVYYATESLTSASDILEASEGSTMTMSHSLSLMDLATSTEYFYYVESEDANGNKATSTENSFTTLAE